MSIENYVMEQWTFLLLAEPLFPAGTSMRKENHGKIQYK